MNIENNGRTKSIKRKIILSFLAVVAAFNIIVALNISLSSRAELMKVTDEHLTYVSNSISNAFHEMNEKEYKMLSTLAGLPLVKDPNVSIEDKFNAITAVKEHDPSYIDITILTQEGKAIAGSTGQFISFAEREYYKVPMTGSRYVTDPFFNKVTGEMAVFHVLPVRSDAGQIINVVFCVTHGYKMCDMVSNITVGKDSHPIAINKKTGKIIACSDKTVVDKGTSIADYFNISSLNNIFLDGASGNNGIGRWILNGKKMVAFYSAIPETDWLVIATAPENDFQAGVTKMLHMVVFIFVIAFVILGCVSYVLIKSSLAPLDATNKAIEKIATGSADLTQRIKIVSDNEVGEIAKGVNAFTEKLQSIVAEIKSTNEDLSNYGDLLGTRISENSKFVSQMTQAIEQIEGILSEQNTKVDSAVSTASEISRAIESLHNLIELQEKGSEHASSAISAMVSSINDVSHAIENMSSEFNNIQKEVKESMDREAGVNSQIQKIENQSKMLEEANDVISSIAEETNLLAMNAAIEAAHAGDAGKGFSVVADEIRKLSENSSEQSKVIGTQLGSMLTLISGVVELSGDFGKSFTSMSTKIEDTAKTVEHLRHSMEEQSEHSRLIGETLTSMNEATSKVRTSSDDVDKARHRIKKDVQSMKESSDTVSNAMDAIRGGVSNIETGDASLMDITSKISDSIHRINNQVDQFKV